MPGKPTIDVNNWARRISQVYKAYQLTYDLDLGMVNTIMIIVGVHFQDIVT